MSPHPALGDWRIGHEPPTNLYALGLFQALEQHRLVLPHVLELVDE